MRKYPKVYALGHKENQDIFLDPEDDVVWEEKIDGGNFRFMINSGNIIFGSRTQQLTSDEGEETNMNKQFKRCADFVRKQVAMKQGDLINEWEGYIFFGECCIKHSMNYDWDKIPPYLGFDVYSLRLGKFLKTKKKFFKALGLEHVPTIKTIKAKEIRQITDKDVPESKYASPSNKDQKAEGIMLKNYSNQIFGKFVRDAFKEKNAEAFGGTPKYGVGEDAKFALRYCTNARIDKHIFKLIDEGIELDLPMMKYLPTRVYEDIWEEEWREIIKKHESLHFRNCRKLVTKRCINVLKQVMVNTTLSEK